jgi:DNA polymerase III delta subunit
MAKSKAPSMQDIEKQLKQKKLLPVYYLFGEDSYSVEITFKEIEKAVATIYNFRF